MCAFSHARANNCAGVGAVCVKSPRQGTSRRNDTSTLSPRCVRRATPAYLERTLAHSKYCRRKCERSSCASAVLCTGPSYLSLVATQQNMGNTSLRRPRSTGMVDSAAETAWRVLFLLLLVCWYNAGPLASGGITLRRATRRTQTDQKARGNRTPNFRQRPKEIEG